MNNTSEINLKKYSILHIRPKLHQKQNLFFFYLIFFVYPNLLHGTTYHRVLIFCQDI